MSFRIPAVVLVLALAVAVAVVAVTVASGPTAQRPPRERARPGALGAAGQSGPLAVLHAWDDRRAAAWASGDRAALGRIYAPGSTARTADLRLLRHYTDRGLVVRGLRMQVIRARVLVARAKVLVLEVTERLAAARAARAGEVGSSRVLPAGTTRTHVLRFRKVGSEWLLAAVSSRRDGRR